MKKLIWILAAFILAACNNDPRAKMEPTGTFGQTFKEDSVVTVNEVLTRLNTEQEFNVTVTGLVKEYCKSEGCWLTLENQGGEPLFVEVENKLFILPHHIDGKIATVKGRATKTTNDAGKSEPLITASGIIIK